MKKLYSPPVLDQYKLVQKAFGARSDRNQRASGRKMSAEITVNQMITSLPGNADGFMRAVLGGRTATNMVVNGNFASGTTGWEGNAASISAGDNILTVTANGTQVYGISRNLGGLTLVGHKIYFRQKMRITSTVCDGLRMRVDGVDVATQGTPVQNTWYALSAVATIITSSRQEARQYYADAATANGKVMEVKEVLAIDLTAMFGAGNEPSTAQCNLMFANWFDGTKSVQAQRVKSVGKNIWGGQKAAADIVRIANNQYTFLTTDEGRDVVKMAIGSTSFPTILKNCFIPNQRYTFSMQMKNSRNEAWCAGFRIYYTDGSIGSVNVFYTLTGYNQVTVTSDEGKSVEKLTLASTNSTSYPVYIDINSIQVEASSVVTSYEPYTESIAYTPGPLRSLPNGVKDEVDIRSGLFIRKMSNVEIINGSMISATVMDKVGAKLIKVPLGEIGVYATSVYAVKDNKIIVTTLAGDGSSDYDNAEKCRLGGVPYNEFWISILDIESGWGESITPSLTQLRTFFNLHPVTFFYQLATPVISKYKDLGQLDALPYGSIITEPVIRGVKLPTFDTGKIAVTTTDAPVSSIESVYRIDTDADGQQVKMDVTSSFTVDADKLGITYVGADHTKPYEYVCTMNPEYSIIPQLTYSYPEATIQDWAIANHNYVGAAADWVLTSVEAQCGILVCTNAGSAANIVVPNIPGRVYMVKNASGQTLTVKSAGDTSGTTILTGNSVLVINGGV